jgi:DNA (cytosine-5)-methyltransferase 1
VTRYLSVCSGIEAATVAWHPLGWEAAAFSEIEAFPRAVLAHHYPDTPCHGDFTTIGADEYGPIDLLVGGTPCQSFSVAGLRGGLADERGNLALEYLRLADRSRPRWLVWENVPGVLSSNAGKDFGTFLGGLAELGYGFAYRILDAQHFGVPQRRRRVFVVGHLEDWRRAAAVLFERHSLSGHPAPRREKGQAAPTIPSRSSAGGGLGTDFDCDGGLIPSTGDVSHCLNAGGMGHQNYETETLIAHSLRAEGFDASEDGTGRGTPLVPVAFNITPSNSNKDYNARESERAQALTAGGNRPSARGGDLIAFAQNQRDEVRLLSVAGAIAAEPGIKQQTYVADTLTSNGDAHSGYRDEKGLVSHASAVRRLTPRECERLQGFPDDYTLIPYRGKPAADGPRYKALGNSMAVPVMRWIGERIALVDASLEEQKLEAA